MISIENEIRHSIDEPSREDVFEKPLSASAIRFPSTEDVQAVKERRAVFRVPKFPGVIGIAEVWRDVLRQDLGHTKASATEAFDDLLSKVFPALMTSANPTDMRSASYALEEPIMTIARTNRCNGGQLNLLSRELSSTKH